MLVVEDDDDDDDDDKQARRAKCLSFDGVAMMREDV